MATIGEWLKGAPPLRAALGVLFLLMATAFSLGAAVTQFNSNHIDLRARTILLEDATVKSDSITVEWRTESARALNDLRVDLRGFFQQDSVYKWKTNCILERLVRGQPLGRYDCDPGHENGEGEES